MEICYQKNVISYYIIDNTVSLIHLAIHICTHNKTYILYMTFTYVLQTNWISTWDGWGWKSQETLKYYSQNILGLISVKCFRTISFQMKHYFSKYFVCKSFIFQHQFETTITTSYNIKYICILITTICKWIDLKC